MSPHPDGVTDDEWMLRKLRLLVFQTQTWLNRMEAAYPEPSFDQRKRIYRARDFLAQLHSAIATKERQR